MTLRRGYGVIQVGRKPAVAHRVAWVLTNGFIPDGLCVLHRCDNRPCVRPTHLFLGTRLDNIQDMVRKGRSLHRYGEANPKVKLTGAQVLEIRAAHAADPKKTIKPLAAKYGVSISAISFIVHRRSWKHI